MANSRHESDGGRSRGKKNIPLNLRVSEDEKKAFERASQIAGIPLSAWIRERLRVAAMRELDNVGEPTPFLRIPGSEIDND